MNDLVKKNNSDEKSAPLLNPIEVIQNNPTYSHECDKYLEKYNLSEERMSLLKSGLVGLVDSILNAYLDTYKNE
jgi:hypothetical protein